MFLHIRPCRFQKIPPCLQIHSFSLSLSPCNNRLLVWCNVFPATRNPMGIALELRASKAQVNAPSMGPNGSVMYSLKSYDKYNVPSGGSAINASLWLCCLATECRWCSYKVAISIWAFMAFAAAFSAAASCGFALACAFTKIFKLLRINRTRPTTILG